MSIMLACLNARGLRDWDKAARLFRDLLSFGVDVTTIEETQFVCETDACVLSSEFVVHSGYGDQRDKGVFLLVKRTLGTKMDVSMSMRCS